ncbi:MAG: hypothetical protein INQ03_15630 [Candidatus Heimdallarchaeota archaeon]|nr:hypothetical protein [Candidatus Heimdallarchaeota archaeon]
MKKVILLVIIFSLGLLIASGHEPAVNPQETDDNEKLQNIILISVWFGLLSIIAFIIWKNTREFFANDGKLTATSEK